MRHNTTYRSQMDQADIDLCESAVKDKPYWRLCGYAKKRMAERSVNNEEVALTLTEGELLEINETQGLCVVMRRIFDNYAVCVVANATTGFIITVWKNELSRIKKERDMSDFLFITTPVSTSDWVQKLFLKGNHVRG